MSPHSAKAKQNRVHRYDIDCRWVGEMPYQRALEMQYSLVEERARGDIPDTILLLEHPGVITMGRRGSDSDLLATPSELSKEGIEVHHITRGGEVTYHGQGQLVGYIIFDIRARIKRVAMLMHGIELALIRFLKEKFTIPAQGNARHPGVWIEDKKIAAVGVSIQRGITLHGFALNISTDLHYFRYIVACGIENLRHTSVQRECPNIPSSALALSKIAAEITPYLSEMHGAFLLNGTRA